LGIYASFNNGDDWQPLQMNLPVASVRDIVVHGNDLVVATHGRSFWVMDDIEPLRELEAGVAGQRAYLFKPEIAVRTRPGTNGGTPYPPDTPHGDNPENGVRIDYYLNPASPSPVVLEILDATGAVVRRYSSAEKSSGIDEKKLIFPSFWMHPQAPLSANAGMHRFLWDMHYAAPVQNTAPSQRRVANGPWAPPGSYGVRLTVDGKSYIQPMQLTIDPRVKATPEDLQKQFAAAMACSKAQGELAPALAIGTSISEQVQRIELTARGNASVERAIAQFEQRLNRVLGEADPGYGLPVMKLNTDASSLRYLSRAFREVQQAMESADAAPTAEQLAALQQNQARLQVALRAWPKFLDEDVASVNAGLRAAGFAEIKANVAANP
jgi:hypothetical protein